MRNGLYKVLFKTPRGEGAGVVFAQDGKMWGGDYGIYYIGTYTVDGDKLSATVNTDLHTKVPGTQSVFGIDKVTINLTGNVSGNIVMTKGNSPQAPGLSFDAILTRLSD